jgi:hypothetical protein
MIVNYDSYSYMNFVLSLHEIREKSSKKTNEFIIVVDEFKLYSLVSRQT